MKFSKLACFLFFLLAVPSSAFARTLEVNVTSKFGGTLYKADSTPLSGGSVQAIVSVGASNGGNYGWVAIPDGSYATTSNIKNDFFTILNLPASSSYTIYIDYKFTVFNPVSGLKNYEVNITKSHTFTDLSTTAISQSRSTGEINVHSNFTTPFQTPTGVVRTVNTTSLTGMSNVSIGEPSAPDGRAGG